MPPQTTSGTATAHTNIGNLKTTLANRNFFLLWIGQIISQIGDRLDQMALIAFIYLRSPGSTMEIAKMLSFTILPVFIIGPLAGAYVDRWDRRRTMYTCDFARAILVLTIPLFLFYSKNITVIYALIFIIFSVGRFFVPAKLSIIPELVPDKDLLLANSLVNSTGMIAAVLGFGISGILVEWLGARSGFYLDSLSFFLSGTLIFLIAKKTPPPRPLSSVGIEIVEIVRKSVAQEIKDGFVYFIKEKSLRFTAGVMFVLASALGALYVVLIVFVQNTLHSATKDLGLLITCLGFGLLAGSVGYGRFGQRLCPYKIIFTCLILSGILLICFVYLIEQYPYFFLAGVLAFILGLSFAPVVTAANTIIHKVSSQKMMGKIFSSLEIVMHVGFIVSMLVSSRLAEKIPHTSILFSVGALISTVGIINLACYHKVKLLPD